MSHATSSPGMPPRLIAGLIGMLLACIAADINQEATSLALADIRGAMGFSVDQGSWFTALYSMGMAMGMLIAPWCAMTFSMRRFAACSVTALAALGVACALAESREMLLVLRWCQGMTSGFLIPLLMAAALRFLTPSLKLYGLAAYGLTATFGPNIATPFVAWANQTLGLDFVYWDILPLCLLAAGLILYGFPQDPLRFERFRQIDWIGLISGWLLCICVVTLFTQGERLDWFNSPLIIALAAASIVLLPVFVINEIYAPLPLIRPQILTRTNFGFGVTMLMGVVALGLGSGALPGEFLAEVQGYRPLQSIPVALLVALPPLLLLPLTASVLNFERTDARWIMASGLVLIASAYWLNSYVNINWIREHFYLGQLIAALGQSMVVVGLLMTSTSVVDPMEGPFASASINTARAMAAPIASGIIGHLLARYEDIHAHGLWDRIGARRFQLAQSAPLSGHDSAGLQWQAGSQALSELHEKVDVQAVVLAYADIWQMMAIFALLLVSLCLLPKRTYAPRFNRPKPL